MSLPAGMAARLLPVAVVIVVVIAGFARVEAGGPWLMRNTVPPLFVMLATAGVLIRGNGRFTGAGFAPPLALAGFAIPALGLAIYLHYAVAVNLDGEFSGGPGQLFRYLPVYTTGAGLIGAAIGWIIGRNVT